MLDPETMPHEFALANSTVKEITNSWQKYSHLLHMTWEALSPSPFTFTLSGLTRLG